MNPWSALLNGGMLAQGRGGGNGERRFHGHDSLSGGRRLVEDGFEAEFAGFGEFEGASEVGTAGRFYEDGVLAGGKFQGGGGVAVEFAVDEDFGGVGLGGDSELAVAVGWGRRDRR